MLYKNTKTGAVIDTPCFISGGDWVQLGKDGQVIDTGPTTNEIQAEIKRLEEELAKRKREELDEENLDHDQDQEESEEELEDQEPEGQEEPAEEDEDIIDLTTMTVASLKKFAAENNIDLGKASRRDDIIKLIAESDAVEVD